MRNQNEHQTSRKHESNVLVRCIFESWWTALQFDIRQSNNIYKSNEWYVPLKDKTTKKLCVVQRGCDFVSKRMCQMAKVLQKSHNNNNNKIIDICTMYVVLNIWRWNANIMHCVPTTQPRLCVKRSHSLSLRMLNVIWMFWRSMDANYLVHLYVSQPSLYCFKVPSKMGTYVTLPKKANLKALVETSYHRLAFQCNKHAADVY